MLKPFTLLLLFALISSIISPDTQPRAYPYPSQPSRQQFHRQFSSNDFVLDLDKLNNTGGDPGGEVQWADVENFPVLSGEGITMVLFELDPCAVNLPHVNPRASETIYVISADVLSVVFSKERGYIGDSTIVNDLKTGQVYF
jgi:oxalate decarboxylase/phosphoglucose isomerase-like protein (cupin superfamily)